MAIKKKKKYLLNFLVFFFKRRMNKVTMIFSLMDEYNFTTRKIVVPIENKLYCLGLWSCWIHFIFNCLAWKKNNYGKDGDNHLNILQVLLFTEVGNTIFILKLKVTSYSKMLKACVRDRIHKTRDSSFLESEIVSRVLLVIYRQHVI